MVEKVKQLTKEKILYLEKEYMNQEKSFDLMQELNDLHIKLILSTAFGEEIVNAKLPYIKDGVTTERPIG